MSYRYHFKAGDTVKVFNGGRLEGTATILKRLRDDDYYEVHFDEDPEGDNFDRWVAPQWQEDGFNPKKP